MPVVGRSRPYARHTKLGKLMWDRGFTATETSFRSSVYHRTLTELLAGRVKPSAKQLHGLCAALGVEPGDILEDSYPFLAPSKEMSNGR
jgi:DNA-binding Xre family transcriptional regulator